MPIQPDPAQDCSRTILDHPARALGLHRILPMAYVQADMSEIWESLTRRVASNAADAAALLDMSMILQSHSRTVEALAFLGKALEIRKDFCVVHGDGTGVRLLAIVTPGDFMANTPLDFLLNGSNAVLWLRYVDETTTELADLPDFDVAILAIGEAPQHRRVLARMEALLSKLDRPILNNDPLAIAGLTRDGVSSMLAAEPSILAPPTRRIDRRALEAVAAGQSSLAGCVDFDFPAIVRPVGTHAGSGMDCIGSLDETSAYLSKEIAAHFYIAPFVDYRRPDGLFCKQRIVFIGGVPFASHMALSSHWMVHYLSAGMTESAAKRAEEARWMETFDSDFAVRHAGAFKALNRHVGLDYFGIDCAELADGRLLVFEVDVAMVVHDMDDAEMFPYKQHAMKKLFNAFVGLAERRAASNRNFADAASVS